MKLSHLIEPCGFLRNCRPESDISQESAFAKLEERRKKVVETDTTLLADLGQELELTGDPMSLLRWTCKKKELLGTFKNTGREWPAKGEDTKVIVKKRRLLCDGKL